MRIKALHRWQDEQKIDSWYDGGWCRSEQVSFVFNINGRKTIPTVVLIHRTLVTSKIRKVSSFYLTAYLPPPLRTSRTCISRETLRTCELWGLPLYNWPFDARAAE